MAKNDSGTAGDEASQLGIWEGECRTWLPNNCQKCTHMKVDSKRE